MYNFHIPRWNELPNIELYLDQVVTLINSSLSSFILNIDSDKKENQVLTKTMINNYVKNNLLDAPIKKKYSKIQLAKLFIICILKQVYSMNDIDTLINLALKQYNSQIAYDNFCDKFENSLISISSKKGIDNLKSKENDNNFLLDAVIVSCSYKIYVQNSIINKKK